MLVLGDKGRRRSEGLGDRHLTLLHVLEVSLPRDVHTRGIVLPCHVHLIDVVGSAISKERIVGSCSRNDEIAPSH
jgi:hypothetical protein